MNLYTLVVDGELDKKLSGTLVDSAAGESVTAETRGGLTFYRVEDSFGKGRWLVAGPSTILRVIPGLDRMMADISREFSERAAARLERAFLGIPEPGEEGR